MGKLVAFAAQPEDLSESARKPDTIWIPGGTYRMGFHRIAVDGFWIDRTPVTNRQFEQFVRAAQYKTCAEFYDVIGNVWEWTADWYSPKHEGDPPKACCIPENPRGGREDTSYDPCQPNIRVPRCSSAARNCAHRTIAAAIGQPRAMPRRWTPTSHVGFRCVVRGANGGREMGSSG